MDDERFVPLLEAPAAAGPPIVFVVGTGSVLVHHDDEHADHDLADAIFLGVTVPAGRSASRVSPAQVRCR